MSQPPAQPPAAGPQTRTARWVALAACALVVVPVVVLEWQPERARWHAAAAAELELRGELEAARQQLDRAVELDPDDPRLLAQRAWLKLAQDPLAAATSAEDLESALGDINRALEMSPGHMPFLQARSEIHLRRGEGAEAVADCQAMLERPSPGYPLGVLLNQLAYTRALTGVDLEEGLKEVEKALGDYHNPQNASLRQQHQYLNALDTRGYLNYLLGNDVEAMRDLSQAVEQFDEWIWGPWDFELEAKRAFDLRLVRLRDATYRQTLAVMLYHRSLVNEKLDPAAAQRDRERIADLLPGYDGRELH